MKLYYVLLCYIMLYYFIMYDYFAMLVLILITIGIIFLSKKNLLFLSKNIPEKQIENKYKLCDFLETNCN
jgi:hypothetical protein